jgi:hypothetical protein
MLLAPLSPIDVGRVGRARLSLLRAGNAGLLHDLGPASDLGIYETLLFRGRRLCWPRCKLARCRP